MNKTPYNKKTDEQFKLELIGLECLNHLDVIGEYTGALNKILCCCKHCGEEIQMIPDKIKKNKTGCKNCYKSKYFDESEFIGKKYNKLTIIKFIDKEQNKPRICICECECGTIKEINFYNVKSGKQQSCGCMYGGKEKAGEYINCVVCGKEFYVKPHRVGKSKYCSSECVNHGQYESIDKICKNCGNDFKVSNSKVHQKFCSVECSNTSKTDMREKRRKQKKSAIISRGNVTGKTVRRYAFTYKPKKCEICGYDECDFCLDIHHADEDCTNNDINNLKVLCTFCHKKLHKKIIDIYGNKL